MLKGHGQRLGVQKTSDFSGSKKSHLVQWSRTQALRSDTELSHVFYIFLSNSVSSSLKCREQQHLLPSLCEQYVKCAVSAER